MDDILRNIDTTIHITNDTFYKDYKKKLKKHVERMDLVRS